MECKLCNTVIITRTLPVSGSVRPPPLLMPAAVEMPTCQDIHQVNSPELLLGIIFEILFYKCSGQTKNNCERHIELLLVAK